ncbi:hypothetical protein DPX16_10257 [Anabarilius grahami]|uniref:Uncharacterized protein n=1 Tax=Anabarilius grahami TaxID=495550 RepID=A0A3N0Y259_ANAGA|nr:hypothetical protein DPX16_10257 [Anabarilius grahami]
MHWTKSACLIELSASMKPLATYKVTEREGTEGAGRYGLAELVPSFREQERDVSLSLRPERSQAESPGYWSCRCFRAGNKARDFVNSEKNIRGDTSAEALARLLRNERFHSRDTSYLFIQGLGNAAPLPLTGLCEDCQIFSLSSPAFHLLPQLDARDTSHRSPYKLLL